METPSEVDVVPDPETLSLTRPVYCGWGCRRENNDGAGEEVLICEDPDRSTGPDPTEPEQNDCHEWNLGLLDLIKSRQPDLLFSAGTLIPNDDSTENIQTGAPEQWSRIMDRGTELLPTRGTPRGENSVADCRAEVGVTLRAVAWIRLATKRRTR
ncbi:hypothetical protein LSI54_08185 [Nesterenkonia sp. AY15]|uniref:hypothetical protein n=1 Tax=Nesterenkonia sp. AY15 TaxID=2901139 RepID=UPI001F4CB8CC|nr:hypothetical protein [Nesterenkonia sp. AY15]MCH8571331.1 hypothetical protein [Nesterenkonia sp. AY15]